MRRFNENSQIVRSFNVNRVNDVVVNTRAALPMQLRLNLRGELLRGKPSFGSQAQPGETGMFSALTARVTGYQADSICAFSCTNGESWHCISHDTPSCQTALTEVDTTSTDDSAAYRPQACATLFLS